jgi:hypothetical protein
MRKQFCFGARLTFMLATALTKADRLSSVLVPVWREHYGLDL